MTRQTPDVQKNINPQAPWIHACRTSATQRQVDQISNIYQIRANLRFLYSRDSVTVVCRARAVSSRQGEILVENVSFLEQKELKIGKFKILFILSKHLARGVYTEAGGLALHQGEDGGAGGQWWGPGGLR